MASNRMLMLLVGLATISVVASVTYNATVEQAIYRQRKRWCSGSKYHHTKLDDKDDEYFNEHCGASSNTSYDGIGPKAVLGSRQELRCMRSRDREGYMAALNQMKRRMVGRASEYDQFVLRHDGRVARPAHFGPSFSGWHREFLTGFERAIRAYCPSCMLPYWDSRLDKRLGGNPANSVYFSSLLMGNAVGDVTTGFARNWPITSGICRREHSRLYRNLDRSTASFYDDDDVQFADDVSSFQDFAYPWSSRAEFAHGYVHNSFGEGSHMLDIMCSPSDPIFFQHHGFVDYIFERMRRNVRSRGSLVYPSTSPSNLPRNFDDSDGHVQNDCSRNAPMLPFEDRVNNYGLVSQTYTDDIYDYERSPGDVDCQRDSDCCANGNTAFLWCNNGQCASKAMEGGRINSGYPDRACHCSSGRPRIVNSVCSCN